MTYQPRDSRRNMGMGLLLAGLLLGIWQSQDATAGTPNNVIHVWSVGSPFTEALPQTVVPSELEQQAQQLGYTIEIQSFRAAGFASTLHEAVATHTEPELITFNNFGVLIGVNTPAGRYPGVLDTDFGVAASLQMVDEKFSTMQPRGWTVLLRSATNYEAARRLIMQPPQCHSGEDVSEGASAGELKKVAEIANRTTWAYLGCDLPALMSQSDDAKLSRQCFMPNVRVQVDAVRSCGVLGNGNLAFVSLAGTFVAQTNVPPPRRDTPYSHWLSETTLGQQSVLAILRKQSGIWRLLAITGDPLDTNPSVYPAHSTLQRLTKLLTNETGDTTAPQPAVLTTADRARVARLSQNVFENFEWTPSESPDVIAEVAEFLILDSSTPRELTRLFFFLGHENRLSSGFLLGVGGRWRVWSISRTGNVSLTESRSYTHR